MTIDPITPRMRRSSAPRRVVATVVVGLCVAACGSAADGSLSGGPATTPVRETPVAAIGLPADDGARIIAVETIRARVRDLTIDSPAVGVQKVRLLVPDRFDARASTRWPVLYLLHGAYGSYLDWVQRTDVEELTAATDILVVMPDAGELGFYSDWWNDGQGGPPMWETFHLIELPQMLERNWQASDRRVVAGLSMGGFGAMEYAARWPGMFLGAASYSGVLDPIGGELDIETVALWGDPIGRSDVWQAHDPVTIAGALRGIPLYVSYGNGEPGPFDNGSVPSDDLEGWIADQNRTFVDRLDQLDISVTVDAYGPGLHAWAYWERALHRSFPLLLEALAS